MAYSMTPNCKNLSMIWEISVFYSEKLSFEPIKNSVHTAVFMV